MKKTKLIKLLKLLAGVFLFLVVVLSAASVIRRLSYSHVIEVSPGLDEPVEILQAIELRLNKPLSLKSLKECQVWSIPEVGWEIQQEGELITLAPTRLLLYGQEYSLSILCPTLEFQTWFNTKNYQELSEDAKSALQIEKDIAFAKEVELVFENQPWREHLPIVSDYFEVNYSQTLNKFFVFFTVATEDNVSQEALREEIRSRLREIGAPDLEILW